MGEDGYVEGQVQLPAATARCGENPESGRDLTDMKINMQTRPLTVGWIWSRSGNLKADVF